MNRVPRSRTLPAAHRSPSAAQPNAGIVPRSRAPDDLPTDETHAPPQENLDPSTAKSPAAHRETSPNAPLAASKSPQTRSSDPAPTKMSDTDPAPADQSAPQSQQPPAA